MKFVHAADLHIDSPLRGLERYEGAPVGRVRGATRRAFENLIALCLAEDAAFLLLGGDIFDGDWKDYGTGLFFAAQIGRLGKAGIPTVLVRGNHDAASQVTKVLALPDHVHELRSRQSETRILEDWGVAVHGQSFATRAVTDDLTMTFPPPVSGLFNIGLLHTCVEGRVGHEPYAPCSVAGLRAKGYDYWALGHVHAREVLCTDPWIVFPGNLQGRQARESGPKGATVVTVSDGRVSAVEARALDVVRWTTCEVEASDAGSADEAVDVVRAALDRAVAEADGRLVAARVILRAGAAVHRSLMADAEKWTQQVRAMGFDVASDDLWIEGVRFEPGGDRMATDGARPGRAPNGSGAPARSPAATPRDDDAVVQFVSALRDLGEDDARLTALADELVDLRRKLPPEVGEGDDGVRLDDPAVLGRLLNDVESLVVGRLAGRRGDPG